MTSDRADFDALNAKRAKEKTKSNVRTLEYARQSAVHMTRVTKDPHWNRYLELLQTEVESAKSIIAKAHAKLSDISLVDPNEIMECKALLNCAQERVRTLDYAISLPKWIQDDGKTAKEELAKLSPVA